MWQGLLLGASEAPAPHQAHPALPLPCLALCLLLSILINWGWRGELKQTPLLALARVWRVGEEIQLGFISAMIDLKNPLVPQTSREMHFQRVQFSWEHWKDQIHKGAANGSKWRLEIIKAPQRPWVSQPTTQHRWGALLFLSRFGENSALYLNTDCVSHCNAFSTFSLRKEFSKEFPCKQPE